jgi:outer membrane protein TolC
LYLSVLCFFFTILSYSEPLWSLTLTPSEVVQRVLLNSPKEEIAKNEYISSLNEHFAWQRNYDLTLSSQLSLDNTVGGDLLGTAAQEDRTILFQTSLSKKVVTGSSVYVNYTRSSLESKQTPLSDALRSEFQVENGISIGIEQDLLANSFGMADRSERELYSIKDKIQKLRYQESLEDLALESLTLFWQAVKAQETLREVVNYREKTESLIRVTVAKRKAGLTSPGELEKFQAQKEVIDQSVKEASATLLSTIDTLRVLLNIDSKINLELKTEEKIPTLPQQMYKSENSRQFQILSLEEKQNRESYTAFASRNLPELSIKGELRYAGLEEESDKSFSELLSLSKPGYYWGLNFSTTFGSAAKSNQKKAQLAKLKQVRIQARLSKRYLGTEDQKLFRQAQVLYNKAISSRRKVRYFDSAYRAIEKIFQKGETDVYQFTTAYQDFIEAISEKVQSVGDYHIALCALEAHRDILLARFQSQNPVERGR